MIDEGCTWITGDYFNGGVRCGDTSSREYYPLCKKHTEKLIKLGVEAPTGNVYHCTGDNQCWDLILR